MVTHTAHCEVQPARLLLLVCTPPRAAPAPAPDPDPDPEAGAESTRRPFAVVLPFPPLLVVAGGSRGTEVVPVVGGRAKDGLTGSAVTVVLINHGFHTVSSSSASYSYRMGGGSPAEALPSSGWPGTCSSPRPLELHGIERLGSRTCILEKYREVDVVQASLTLRLMQTFHIFCSSTYHGTPTMADGSHERSKI